MKRITKVFFVVLVLLLAIGLPAEAKNSIGGIHRANPDGWEQSTLIFEGGCTVDCKTVHAKVCNQGQTMQGSTAYEIWYSATGNPKLGEKVFNGTIEPLAAGECIDLVYSPGEKEGNYMFRVFQRPDHPGEGELWSSGCYFEVCPTAVETELRVSVEGQMATVEVFPPEAAEGGILTLEQNNLTQTWVMIEAVITIEIEEGIPGKITFWSPSLLEGPIIVTIP